MPYNTVYLSLRMSLDDVVKDSELEKTIIENIRYCRRIVGKEFKVIFYWEFFGYIFINRVPKGLTACTERTQGERNG